MLSVNYDYLRPLKADNLKRMYEASFTKKTDLKCQVYHNAVILPLKRIETDGLLFGRGGVVDEDGNYIEDSAIDQRVQFGYEFKTPKKENKKVVYCGYLINHWGHFLIEAVARLWYFFEKDESVDEYVFFTKESGPICCSGNYKEFLELFGIYSKVRVINTPTQYRDVLIPELSYKRLCYYSDYFKRIFDVVSANIHIEESWEKSDKLFLTRSQYRKANESEFGMEMLDSLFLNNHYRVIAPEKISLSELIYLIRNANVCAVESGSLPHNMLFARDGQKLTIIERITMNNEIQVNINQIKDLIVTYVDAHSSVYPVPMRGPALLIYEGKLKNYVDSYGLVPPEEKYTNIKYRDKCFKKYINAYLQIHGYRWFMFDWYFDKTEYIYEAYEDSLKRFWPYLSRVKPIFFYQYFQKAYRPYIREVLMALLHKALKIIKH